MREPTSLDELRAAQAATPLLDTLEVSPQSQGGGKAPPAPPGSTEPPDQPEEPYRPANHPSEWKSPFADWPPDPGNVKQTTAAARTAKRIYENKNARQSDRSEDVASRDKYEEQSAPENGSPSIDLLPIDDLGTPELTSNLSKKQSFVSILVVPDTSSPNKSNDRSEPKGEISDARAARHARMFSKPLTEQTTKYFDTSHSPENSMNYANNRKGRGES